MLSVDLFYRKLLLYMSEFLASIEITWKASFWKWKITFSFEDIYKTFQEWMMKKKITTCFDDFHYSDCYMRNILYKHNGGFRSCKANKVILLFLKINFPLFTM